MASSVTDVTCSRSALIIPPPLSPYTPISHRITRIRYTPSVNRYSLCSIPLYRTVKTPKRWHPLATLKTIPREVLGMVFRCLDTRSQANFSVVCREYREVYKLYRQTITHSQIISTMTYHDLHRIVTVSNKITEIVVSSRSNLITPVSIALIARTCANLKTLKLKYTIRKHHYSGWSPRSMPFFAKIRGCDVSRRAILNLRRETQVKEVNLLKTHVSDMGINQLAMNCKALEVLNLWGAHSVSDLSLMSIATHCAHITTIRINSVVEPLSDTGIVALTSKCHKLRVLSLRHCRIGNTALMGLSTHCPDLHTLHVGFCAVSSKGILKLANSCRNLRVLHIEAGDDECIAELSSCTQLVHVVLLTSHDN